MQIQTARYFVYSQKLGTQRHLFSIRAEVRAETSRVARERFKRTLPRRHCVIGVKQAAGEHGGRTAQRGHWIG